RSDDRTTIKIWFAFTFLLFTLLQTLSTCCLIYSTSSSSYYICFKVKMQSFQVQTKRCIHSY
ncbi:unnamed protein product, partial [Musa textilis]